MSKPNPVATSLLTEHLQYTPISLIDDIINTVNELIYKSVLSVEQFLESADPAILGFNAPPPSTSNQPGATNSDLLDPKLEIEEGVHKLETLLENSVDKDFDKLEIYVLRNVFMVPDDVVEWVRLRHYENLNFTPPPDAPTRESIALLRRKLLAAQKLHASLLRESARNEQLIAQLSSLLSPASHSQPSDLKPETSPSPFTFLTPSSSSQPTTTQNLTSTTKFTTTQLPSLRSALSLLRPKLSSSLPTPSADTEETERRIYIERQTRRHLEGVQGMELEDGGGVRDGEWQGRGARVGKGELGALEGVVGLVGGGDG